MENLLAEVTFGTTLYLKEVAELEDDCVAEKGVSYFNTAYYEL